MKFSSQPQREQGFKNESSFRGAESINSSLINRWPFSEEARSRQRYISKRPEYLTVCVVRLSFNSN